MFFYDLWSCFNLCSFFSNSSNDKLVKRHCWHASLHFDFNSCNYSSFPAGEPSASPRFPRGFIGEFSMRIFPPPFAIESLRIFSVVNFPHISLKISKCNTRTQDRLQLCENITVLIWWIKLFSGFGQLPSHFNRDLKLSMDVMLSAISSKIIFQSAKTTYRTSIMVCQLQDAELFW